MTNSAVPQGRTASPYLVLPLLFGVLLFLAGCVEARTAATEGWSGVTVYNGYAYIGTEDARIIQLDAQTGVPRSAPFAAPQDDEAGFPAFYGTPTISGGLLFAGGYHGMAYAMRAETLDGVRSFEVAGNPLTKGIAGSVVPVGDSVVIAAAEDANEGRIYVLEAETMVEECRYPAQGEDPVGQIWSTPAVVNGVVFVGSMDHRLHAVRVDDCSPVWDEPANLHGAVVALACVG